MKEIYMRTNSNVLLVAYRGFSDSQGTPTEQGLQRDSEAVLEWAINYKNTHLASGSKKYLYIMGRSLGGAVSIYIATHPAYAKEIDGIIL
jgi:alpha/beta superfamily hydrolase